MTPNHTPAHIELVAGQSDVCSFEHEIERGKLGTTREYHEIHGNSTLEFQHKKLWLAVVGRAAKDAGEIEMEDLDVADASEDDVAAPNKHALGDRYDAKFDALEWFGSGDFNLVMEFVGLEPVAAAIARMPPGDIVTNLAAFEKKEERERKERTRK